MRFEEIRKRLSEAAKAIDNVALMDHGDEIEIIVLHKGGQETIALTRDAVTKNVVGKNGMVLFHGRWTAEDGIRMDESVEGDVWRLSFMTNPAFELVLPHIVAPRAENAGDVRQGDDKPMTIYTDGSCRKKRGAKTGQGAWAYIIVENGGMVASASNFVPHTTSMDMELLAIAYAMKNARKMDATSLVIYSDCRTLVEMLNRDRTLRREQDTFARDVMQKYRSIEATIRFPVTWHWVKGHDGDRWNEVVDGMVQTVTKKMSRRRKTV